MEAKLAKGRESIMLRKSSGSSATTSAHATENRNLAEINHPTCLEDLTVMSGDALDTDDEKVDPTFDLDESMKSDSDHLVEIFCEEFVILPQHEVRVGLDLFLYFQLNSMLNKSETEAAELSGMMIGKSEKNMRDWKNHFFKNEGEIPFGKQGHYQSSGILWSNEELNKKA